MRRSSSPDAGEAARQCQEKQLAGDTLNSNLGSLSESLIFPSAGTINTLAQQYESTSEQSTQYKCSLEVLCKLCFGTTVTKSNEDRVLPLIGAVVVPEYFSASLSLLN